MISCCGRMTIPMDVPSKGFDAEKLLEDRFGKFIRVDGGKRTTVRLLFKPQVAGYVAERTWHPKQKVKWRRDGSVELAFPVVDVRDVSLGREALHRRHAYSGRSARIVKWKAHRG